MTSAPGQPILIVIGASAGGIEPLMEIAGALPQDLPAAVCVVVHFPDTADSYLPAILSRRSRLVAIHAPDGEALQAGCIYVAPPGQHLLVADGHLRLSRGPRENSHRPSIDTLFRTAARAFGPRAIGVILSGTMDDGTLGLRLIKAHGGLAVVQDPAEALFNVMPLNAMAATPPDRVLPAAEIGPALARLAYELADLSDEELEARSKAAMTSSPELDPIENEAAVVAQDKAELERNGRKGEPSMLTCPDCGGVLWEVGEGELLRYRCHVGHAYSADGLRAEQASMLEGALWTALRALEESAALGRRLAHRAHERGSPKTAQLFEARAREDEQRADLVRQALAMTTAPPESLVGALDSGGGTG